MASWALSFITSPREPVTVDLAAAVVDDLHLDGQGLAADAGPGQAVGNADGIGAVEERPA